MRCVSAVSESRATSGATSSCASARSCAHALGERGHEPRLVARRLRHRPHPQRQLGEHAERPLGAEHQPREIGPGRRARRAQRRELPGRRHAAHRGHEVVEAAEARRGLAGRARRGAAPGRGPLVALRVVAEAQPVAAQREVELRQSRPRPGHGPAGDRIDRPHAVEPGEVEADDGVEAAALPRHAADDARPAAERHHGRARLRAGGEDRGDLLRPARRHDHVRRLSRVAGPQRQQVEVGLARRTHQPDAVVGPYVLRADRRLEPRAQAGHLGRRAQPHGRPRPPAAATTSPESPSSSRSSASPCSPIAGPAPGSPQPWKTCSRLTCSAPRSAPCRPARRRAAAAPPAAASAAPAGPSPPAPGAAPA